MKRGGTLSRQAAALRRAFDRGFAEPHPPPAPPTLDLLAIRLGGEAWAIPLADVAGLHSGRDIAPVPTRTPALLGLAGFRGALLSVYDLAALIGLPPAAAPRWLAVAAEHRVALAFAELEGHRRLAIGDIAPAPPEGAAWMRGFIATEAPPRPILHLPAVLGGLPGRCANPRKGNDP